MYRLCYMSGFFFSVLKLQCLVFFSFFKHAVVLLVNTLQPVKMAHALTCIHVHVLRVIPELIVILLLVCRILVYLLKNVHTRLVFFVSNFSTFPPIYNVIFFFFSIFCRFVLFQTCNNSANLLFCFTF